MRGGHRQFGGVPIWYGWHFAVGVGAGVGSPPAWLSIAGSSATCSGRSRQEDALAAFDVFVETWGVKYDKAGDALLAFYDFQWSCTLLYGETDETRRRASPTIRICDL
jgi:hypothetical protein